MEVLNEGFAGTGLRFSLESVDYVTNSNWFNNVVDANSTVARDMKKQLKKGNGKALEVFTLNLPDGYSGWTAFPQDYHSDPSNDGVLLWYDALPGSSDPDFSGGKLLVHETGHWAGLYHTFQGNTAEGVRYSFFLIKKNFVI